MRRRAPSIRNRVRAVIFLASFVVVLATASAFVIYEVISFKSQMARSLTTLASVIADNSRLGLVFQNRNTAQEVLSTLRAEPDIEVAALYDVTGKLFVSYPETVPEHLLPKRLFYRSQQFTSEGLLLFEPVFQENKAVGTLFMRMSFRALNMRLWNYSGIVGIVLLGSFAGAFLLSTLLQRRISDPILALSTTARTVADRGDYSIRAEKLTEDEVGVLTESFNHLLDQIQQREQALRKSEQDLRDQLDLVNTITDNTPSCLWMLDLEGRCTFANPASEQISGFKPQELLSKRLHEVVHYKRPDGAHFPVAECTLDGLRRTHKPVQGHEDTFIHKLGHFYPVRCNSRPIIKNGNPVGTVLEVQDITDIVKARDAMAQYRQRLELTVAERTAALRETVQQLETFSYSIVHDMRAPLRTMNSFAQLIDEEEGAKLSQDGRDYLGRIMAGAQRLDALINDVLAYSRVSKGEASLTLVPLDALVTDIVREYPDLHAKADCIHVQRPLPRVVGNTALLTQCISNLIGNALKFVQAGREPHVVVRCEELGDNVRLWVEDNGIGIPREYRTQLFGLFQRLNTSAQYPGTGVGLAIVKRAVERMNGTIGVESEPGQGSRFWIELPRA